MKSRISKAYADLQANRRREPRECPGCGEVKDMLFVQRVCSARCRQRVCRVRKGAAPGK